MGIFGWAVAKGGRLPPAGSRAAGRKEAPKLSSPASNLNPNAAPQIFAFAKRCKPPRVSDQGATKIALLAVELVSQVVQ
jgi:hypothetical protein